MRLLAVAAALLMLLPMPVAGQEPVGVAADPAEDVRTEAQGTAAPANQGSSQAYASLDLVGLAIAESAADLTFTITVADLKASGEQTAVDGVRFETFFAHHGRGFRLTVDQILPALAEAWFVSLDMRDTAGAEWTQLWASDEARGDPEADTVSVTVRRNLLADRDGAAPFPGRALEGIAVRSSAFLSNVTIFGGLFPDVRSPAKVLDDMPDGGQPAVRYDVSVGLVQTGHAVLSSEVPYRASNGEATTFLYNATARNLADREDTFEFAAVGAPGRLAVTVPVTAATIPAGGTVSIPVLVTVPFAHVHGGVDGFTLEMRSTTDPGSVGRLAMGVSHLAVPQPAGHHDALYLHSSVREGLLGEAFPDGYMNTLSEDESDSGQPVPSPSQSINVDTVEHTWRFPLEPGLQMGLDFDLARIGRLSVPIAATVVPQMASTVEAFVYVAPEGMWRAFGGDGVVEVAHMAPTAPVDLLPESTHLFEGDLVPLPAGDRIPFEPGPNLYLDVVLTTVSPSVLFTERPVVAPGGHLTLPLLEYHDPVDEALALLDGPGLSPLGAQERLVNPGEAVVFPFSLANPADEARTYHIEASGVNQPWATIPDDHISVPAHGTATGSLVLRAPAGTADGERADLILQAYDTAQPTARGLLRLLAEVDTDADHPDDTAAADELSKKESPAPAALPGAIAGLAAFALLRRRSR